MSIFSSTDVKLNFFIDNLRLLLWQFKIRFVWTKTQHLMPEVVG